MTSQPTAGVTRAGADGETPSDEKKAEARKLPVKRADSPASGARFVGRRYGNELDSQEHDSSKQLRQHGFESPEKPCAASADERTRTHCATKHILRRPNILKQFLYSYSRRCMCVITGAILHDPQMNSRYFSRRPTACVTGGWGEKAWKRKVAKVQNNAQKTRTVPAVRCTLC